jgi:hypothetical protein
LNEHESFLHLFIGIGRLQKNLEDVSLLRMIDLFKEIVRCSFNGNSQDLKRHILDLEWACVYFMQRNKRGEVFTQGGKDEGIS